MLLQNLKRRCVPLHSASISTANSTNVPFVVAKTLVGKWELENLLTKADLDLSNDAKSALVQRQLMGSLPNPIKLKLLEHNPTPNVEEMLAFTQRYRAIEGYTSLANSSHVVVSESAATIAKDDSQLSKLVTMVTGIAEKQQSIENRLAKAERSSAETTQNERRERPRRRPQSRRPPICSPSADLLNCEEPCRTCRSYLSHWFKLLRDDPNSCGSSDHPTVSINDIDIHRPFVDCQLDGVSVVLL